MRRHLAVPLALVVLASAGLAPPAPAQRPRDVAPPQAHDALRAAFAARDPASAEALASAVRIDVHARSGAARRLVGRMPLDGGDLAARAADFVERFGPLFGADDEVTLGAPDVLMRTDDGAVRHARMAQSVHGHTVLGHGLTLRFEGADAVHAHGVVSREAAALAPPALTAADARAIAETSLAALGHAGAALLAEPVVQPVARLTALGPRLLHRVEVVVRAGMTPYVVEVDAHTGAVVRTFIDRETAAGTFHWDGIDVPFATGKGKGLVYKTVKSARTAKESGSSLKNLIAEDAIPAVALDGMLTGRFSQVFNEDGIFVVSSAHDFSSADDSPQLLGGAIVEWEVFDHVNGYYWIDRMGSWFGKQLGPFGADVALPAIMNFDDGGLGFANAFYSPVDLDGIDGYGPGYFVFGDFDNITGDPMDDMSRDPTIVCHEYTHAVVDKQGFPFGDGELDTPSRAVNEALADYFAASYLNEPAVGPVFMAHSADDLVGLSGESLRHLENDHTMPDDLFAVLGATTDLPEEHEAGAIFGGALWRTRKALKKKADGLFLDVLGDWPQSNAEAGYPVVDTGNADDAYHAFKYLCFEAAMDHALAQGKQGAKAAAGLLGAFLSHGVTGTRVDTTYTIDATAEGLVATLQGEFLGSIDEHVFGLVLAPGQVVSLTLTGHKQDGTQVDFAFDDDPGDFTYTQDPVVATNGTKTSQKNIEVVNAGTYTLTLANPGGAGGRYKAKLKVK